MTIGNWNGARVLVTGARGFIARRLCVRLVDAGARVYGVSRQPNGVDSPRMHWRPGTLTELVGFRDALSKLGPDIVYHLAGHVTGSQQMAEVQPTFAANLASTVHLLTAAAERRNCRVILAGSMQEPDHAASSDVPCSPYAVSKWACTAYARMFHALYKLPVVVARPMMVYGPGQWDRSKMLPYVITSLLKGTAPRLTSGSRELDWVYVEDVIDGLMTAALCEGVDGQAIDFGSGQLTTIRALADEIAAIIGGGVVPVFGAVPDRPLEAPRVARVTETRTLTGWVATTPLRDGLEKTVAWYRDLVAQETLATADKRTPFSR
jgi:UDP-glucose 4-epimerase